MWSPGKGDGGRRLSQAHHLLQTIQPARQLRISVIQSPLSIQSMELPACMMILTAAHAQLVAGNSGARGGRRQDHQPEGRTQLSVEKSPSMWLNPNKKTHKDTSKPIILI